MEDLKKLLNELAVYAGVAEDINKALRGAAFECKAALESGAIEADAVRRLAKFGPKHEDTH